MGTRTGSTTGDATTERPHIANGRDDCRVPWIRTYSPERARMGTDTDCVHPTIVPLKGICRDSTTGDATMKLSHIADGRDDCWVPWIRTNSPERARMGTDTDCVHPTIVPLEGICGGLTTGDATMELKHVADGRDDCWVPWIRTNSPERARMGTDTDCVRPTILPAKGICGGLTTH